MTERGLKKHQRFFIQRLQTFFYFFLSRFTFFNVFYYFFLERFYIYFCTVYLE